MTKKAILFLIISFTFLSASALLAQDGFTQKDRELLIELKVKMGEIDKRFEQIDKRFEQIDKRFEQIDKRFEQIDKRFEQIDKRFEQVDKRFEQMMDFLKILSAIFTSLVIAVIGFAYWDRRTIIKKAKEETIAEIEKEGRLRDLIMALRELAKRHPELAELLKQFRLL